MVEKEMDNIITMPLRFDYDFNYEFNKAVDGLLKNESAQTIVLDCESMEHIDSVGIGLLVMAHKRAQANHKTISLINITDAVREILLLTNLQKIIQF